MCRRLLARPSLPPRQRQRRRRRRLQRLRRPPPPRPPARWQALLPAEDALAAGCLVTARFSVPPPRRLRRWLWRRSRRSARVHRRPAASDGGGGSGVCGAGVNVGVGGSHSLTGAGGCTGGTGAGGYAPAGESVPAGCSGQRLLTSGGTAALPAEAVSRQLAACTLSAAERMEPTATLRPPAVSIDLPPLARGAVEAPSLAPLPAAASLWAQRCQSWDWRCST